MRTSGGGEDPDHRPAAPLARPRLEGTDEAPEGGAASSTQGGVPGRRAAARHDRPMSDAFLLYRRRRRPLARARAPARAGRASRSAAARAATSRCRGTTRCHACTRSSSGMGADWVICRRRPLAQRHVRQWRAPARPASARRRRRPHGRRHAVSLCARAGAVPDHDPDAPARARGARRRHPRPAPRTGRAQPAAARRRRYAAPASNREIADELVLSVETVKGTLSALFERFGLTDLPQNAKRAALAARALELLVSGSRSASACCRPARSPRPSARRRPSRRGSGATSIGVAGRAQRVGLEHDDRVVVAAGDEHAPAGDDRVGRRAPGASRRRCGPSWPRPWPPRPRRASSPTARRRRSARLADLAGQRRPVHELIGARASTARPCWCSALTTQTAPAAATSPPMPSRTAIDCAARPARS